MHAGGEFQRKFCESRRKVGTIPYRTIAKRMISRVGAAISWIMIHIMELRLGHVTVLGYDMVRRALHCIA